MFTKDLVFILTLSHLNLVHTLATYCFTIHITLAFTPSSTDRSLPYRFSTKHWYVFLTSHVATRQPPLTSLPYGPILSSGFCSQTSSIYIPSKSRFNSQNAYHSVQSPLSFCVLRISVYMYSRGAKLGPLGLREQCRSQSIFVKRVRMKIFGPKRKQMTELRFKIKVKLSLCLLNYALCLEDIRGSWRYSSTILDLGIRWRWVVNFTLRSLWPQYALDRRLGGPQSWSGRCGAEKSLLPLPEVELLPSNPQLIAIQTELSRLLGNNRGLKKTM
jgi:hypothetical protein